MRFRKRKEDSLGDEIRDYIERETQTNIEAGNAARGSPLRRAAQVGQHRTGERKDARGMGLDIDRTPVAGPALRRAEPCSRIPPSR